MILLLLTGIWPNHLIGYWIFIRYQIKPEQVECVLNHFELKYTTIADTCPIFPDCDLKTFNSPFRTITGICNNIHPPGHVPWGVPRTQYQRALAPNYADGIKSR
jgi:peroxidase